MLYYTHEAIPINFFDVVYVDHSPSCNKIRSLLRFIAYNSRTGKTGKIKLHREGFANYSTDKFVKQMEELIKE